MCATYQVCKDLGLEYKIGHFYPFNLYDYLQPNHVDWYIREEDIEWDKRLVEIVFWEPLRIELTRWKTGAEHHDFNIASFSKRLTAARDKRQIHVYGNLHCIGMQEAAQSFHELFKPSVKMKNLVDQNKQQIGGPYVSISTRFRNLLGDFKDRNSLPAPQEEQKEYISRCIDIAEAIHQKHEGLKVLVTSDSTTFLNEVAKKDYVYVIPGEIGHVEYHGSSEQNVHMKTFMDMFAISGADKVYQIVGGKMYGGAFSHMAACIANKPYEIVRFG